jgi:hypothetical protein
MGIIYESDLIVSATTAARFDFGVGECAKTEMQKKHGSNIRIRIN